MRLSSVLLVIGLLVFSGHRLVADDFIQWSNSSISLLRGTGFEVTGDDNRVITLENATAWKYGDSFAFLDIIHNHDNPFNRNTWYGEFSPRFSLVKMGLIDLPDGGVLRDINIATTYERGEGGNENLLVGLGTGLKVDGFRFLNVNLYGKDRGDFGLNWDDAQITVAWSRPFTIGDQQFVVDGFADWLWGLGSQTANLHIVPQIKWDMGAAIGIKPGTLWLGTELDYWHNKFGIRSTDTVDSNQFAASALVKFHF